MNRRSDPFKQINALPQNRQCGSLIAMEAIAAQPLPETPRIDAHKAIAAR